MELTDDDRRFAIELLQSGQPLPDRFRFSLFEQPREAELIWPGKTHEVTQAILPFQSIEQIDEPRTEAEARGTMDLFSRDVGSGRQAGGWSNKLIWGDNKLVLSSLKGGPLRRQIEDAGGLKLVYIDPPFDVGADFSIDIPVGEDDVLTKEPSLLEEIAYRDTWGRGSDSYAAMIYERLILIESLMAANSTIFVHCDWHVNSIVKSILSEVFGRESYVNEVIWYYYNKMQGNVNKFASNHDTIFFFKKGNGTRFAPIREKRGEVVKQIKRVWDKEKGSIVNAKGPDGKVLYIETDERND